MLRKVLEPKIDALLARRLTDHDFLARIIDRYNSEGVSSPPVRTVDAESVSRHLEVLKGKRQRILDTYFDGMISREDRDRRVEDLDGEIGSYESLLWEQGPAHADEPRPLDAEKVWEIVEPFIEWEFLTRENRRALLELLCPEIRVYHYEIKGLRLILDGCYEDSRSRTAW